MKRGVKSTRRMGQRKRFAAMHSRASDLRKHVAGLHKRVAGMHARLSAKRSHGMSSGKRHVGRKAATRGAKSVNRHQVFSLAWRTVVWLAIVFVILPQLFDILDIHKLFTFNSNVAGLFILALLGAFAIWRRETLLKAEIHTDLKTVLWTGLIAALFFWLSFQALVGYRPQSTIFDKALIIFGMQASYAVGALLLAILFYGVHVFVKERRALVTGAIVGISYVGFSLLFRQLWPILSNLVVGLNAYVLRPFGSVSIVPGPAPSLVLNGFGVVIGEACAGVDSAILFSGVFLFIALLDWPRLKQKLFIGMLPFGLIGMFLVNVLRVALLMIVGAYYSPAFALSMFHDNAGWILFVIYTLCFWWWAYPRVTRSKSR